METKMTVKDWASKYVVPEIRDGETSLMITADAEELNELKHILTYDKIQLGKAFLMALKAMGVSVCLECRTVIEGEHPHTISV